MPADVSLPHTPVYARDPASQPLLLQGAIEGHVLVKNVNKALPLNKPKLLTLVGYDAIVPPVVDFEPPVPGLGSFGPYSLGVEAVSSFQPFFDALGPPSIAPNGTIISGGEGFAVCPFAAEY